MGDNTHPSELRDKDEEASKISGYKLVTKKLAKGFEKAIISHPAVRNVGG